MCYYILRGKKSHAYATISGKRACSVLIVLIRAGLLTTVNISTDLNWPPRHRENARGLVSKRVSL